MKPRPTRRRLLPQPSDRCGCRNQGSALLLVLFVCLAIAVVVQALSTVTLCAQAALSDESVGRARLHEKEIVLAWLGQDLLRGWRPIEPSWSQVEGPYGLVPTEGRAEAPAEGADWVMKVASRHDPALSLSILSATVERGRDGIDLPLAAVVARRLMASAEERELPWVDGDAMGGEPSLSPALCYLQEPPTEPVLGASCTVRSLSHEWRLDPGWLRLVEEIADGEPVAAVAAENTFCLTPVGPSASLPPECRGQSPDAPALIVLSGSADLDASGGGDLYAVIVVDGGSVLLDGTILHGAVFATGDVELGATGQVLFSRRVLRWATDQSLRRVRLVPGTRWEAPQ